MDSLIHGMRLYALNNLFVLYITVAALIGSVYIGWYGGKFVDWIIRKILAGLKEMVLGPLRWVDGHFNVMIETSSHNVESKPIKEKKKSRKAKRSKVLKQD